MNKIKERETKAVLGECLHTALRKACDSHATSLAWNLVYLIPDARWDRYLDFIHEAMKSTSPENRLEMLKKRSLELPSEDNAFVCLRLTFEMFDGKDWKGYGVYLSEVYSE